jgi:hypothetical protein
MFVLQHLWTLRVRTTTKGTGGMLHLKSGNGWYEDPQDLVFFEGRESASLDTSFSVARQFNGGFLSGRLWQNTLNS